MEGLGARSKELGGVRLVVVVLVLMAARQVSVILQMGLMGLMGPMGRCDGLRIPPGRCARLYRPSPSRIADDLSDPG